MDVFRKYAKLQSSRDVLVTKAMENVNAEEIIESVFELKGRTMSATELSGYKTRINNILNSKDFRQALIYGQTNDSFEKVVLGDKTKPLDRGLDLGDEFNDFFNQVMLTSEREFDGLGILNKKLLDRSKKQTKRINS